MILTTASSRTSLRTLRGWPLFIVLSLLIHTVILLLWYLFYPRHPANDAFVAPFSVQIVTTPTTPQSVVPPRAGPSTLQNVPAPVSRPSETRQPAAQPTPKQPAGRTERPRVMIPDQPEDQDSGNSLLLPDIFHDEREPATPAPEEEKRDDESRIQIESLIRTRFAEHFSYPPMAQSHGWQGEVLLSFLIGLDGTLTHIQVVRSSGHAILDQAALDSMRNIKRIEFAPGMVLHHELELHMPVIYRLAQR